MGVSYSLIMIAILPLKPTTLSLVRYFKARYLRDFTVTRSAYTNPMQAMVEIAVFFGC